MTLLQWMLLFFAIIVTGIVAWVLYSSFVNSTDKDGAVGNNLSDPNATLFAGEFQSAIAMAQRSPRYFYIVEQLGKLWRVDAETGERIVVLDMSDMLKGQLGIDNRGGERGLLGVAFSERLPNQAFISYSAPPPLTDGSNDVNHIARLSQFTISNPDQANERFNNERVLIDVPQDTDFHHAQTVAFDSRTGYLYYSLGDGGPQKDPENNAQNLHDLRGKMLRIAVSEGSTSEQPYTIPPENPFFQAPQQGAPEILALGLRNPWRFSIDEANDRLFIGDVGFGSEESIDMLQLSDTRAGKEPVNFGWNVYEGTNATNFDNAKLSTKVHTGPIYEYQTGGQHGRAVVGGYALDKTNYIFADFVSGKLMTIATGDGNEKPKKWVLKNDWSPEEWLPADKRNDLGSNIKIPSLYKGLDDSMYVVVWGDSNKSAVYRLFFKTQ